MIVESHQVQTIDITDGHNLSSEFVSLRVKQYSYILFGRNITKFILFWQLINCKSTKYSIVIIIAIIIHNHTQSTAWLLLPSLTFQIIN